MLRGAAAVLIVASVCQTAPALAQVSVPAQPRTTDNSPVSMERIRRALQQPETVSLTVRQPDFSVSISEEHRFRDIYGEAALRKEDPRLWRSFFVQGVGGGTAEPQPLIAVDVLAMALAAKNKIQTAWYHRSERKAREFVRQELEAFCAIQGCVPPDSEPSP